MLTFSFHLLGHTFGDTIVEYRKRRNYSAAFLLLVIGEEEGHLLHCMIEKVNRTAPAFA